MPGYIIRKFHCVIILILAGPIFFYSCTPRYTSGLNGQSGTPVYGGYLSIFLNLQEDQKDMPLQVHISEVAVLADTGEWIPVEPDTDFLDAEKIGAGQIFLGRSILESGYYTHLRLTLDNAVLRKKEKFIPLTLGQKVVELVIPSKLNMQQGDSHSLFIVWDVSDSFVGDHDLNPSFSIRPGLRKLIADIAYVSCPEINTVFMIRTDKNMVYDSLGVPDAPYYLFPDSDNQQNDLFALTESSPSIKRIGSVVNKVVEEYRLPMIGQATHMALGPNGQYAYIVDRQRGTLVRVDLQSGGVDKRLRLGYGPVYVIYIKKRNLLAVSLSISQNVILVDAETFTQVASIDTANSPEGLAVLDDTTLYIAESGANSVQVYDLVYNRFKQRIPVGINPRRIITTDRYIYVSNSTSQSLSLLREGQLGAARDIPLTGEPLELDYVQSSKWIYVSNVTEKSITVIDPSTSKKAASIYLGTTPAGIAVMKTYSKDNQSSFP